MRFWQPAVADAFDHGGVVERVGKDQAARQQPAEDRECRLVGDVARGEEEGRLLAVELGELALEQHVTMVRPRDVAGTPGPGTIALEGRLHGLQDACVLAHAEIVVAAPHHHLAHPAVGGVVEGCREGAGAALEVGEDAIAPFRLERPQCLAKMALIIHQRA